MSDRKEENNNTGKAGVYVMHLMSQKIRDRTAMELGLGTSVLASKREISVRGVKIVSLSVF